MTALTLEMIAKPGQRLDLSVLAPGLLAGLSAQNIEVLPLHTTKEAVHVGDLFSLKMGEPSTIKLLGLTSKCDHIGLKMDGGEIHVEGDVGAYFGACMKSGRLTLSGSAGVYAGASLKGGRIEIKGHVGAFAGAPYRGEMHGIGGGIFHVHGTAGEGAGDRMRRGLLVIGGSSGDYTGSRMIAGTIIVAGDCGRYAGYGMRRGSLILTKPPPHLLPTFVDCGSQDLGFLSVLKKSAQDMKIDDVLISSHVQRFQGDMAALGKGEILVLS